MIGLLTFIVVIGTALLIHEFGHFIVAKKCGVRCGEFSIGMGPPIFKITRGETVYILRLFPVGGSVSMDSVMGNNPIEGCFESKSKLKRAAILSAGATMNFFLAFLLVFSIGILQGKPNPSNELAYIFPGMPAQVAGLEIGDRIISYQGAAISNGEELVAAIHRYQGDVSVRLLRNGEVLEVDLTPNSVLYEGQLVSQIGLQVTTDHHFSLPYAFQFGFSRLGTIFYELLRSLQMLLFTGEVGISELSGPLGVYQMAATVSHQGIFSVLLLGALINVNLGLFNLFPLPALDGGKLIFVAIEGVFKKAVPAKLENNIHLVGFTLFMGLFLLTFFNDLLRLRA